MTNELLPADLTSAHLGQYIRISGVRPLGNGETEATLVVGQLVGVDHTLDGPNSEGLATTATVRILLERVPLFLPPRVPVTVSASVDDLAPVTQ